MIRRSFLQQVAGAGAMASAAAPAEPLPWIQLGNVRVSRLIAGSNPIGGYAYATVKLSRHMVNYFTVERTAEFLLRCEQLGINTFQGSSSPVIQSALALARERGSKLQFILLASGFEKSIPPNVLEMKPFAVCHHGGVTDRLFRAERHGEVRDFVKRVHDAGMAAGISTHNPDHLARIEDVGWENDFYMTCFYYLTRTPEELKKLVVEPTVEQTTGDYLFFAGDPDRMTRRIRQVAKPCLAFKVLGAGRLCKTPQMLEKAFAYAYSNIKPIDGVIAGMYPVFSDEPAQNADLVRRFGTTAKPRPL
jgi:hypothetical protein